MVLALVSVRLHAKRAAVFMAEPARDGGNIHAAFDADCGEQVAQIMMRDALYPDLRGASGNQSVSARECLRFAPELRALRVTKRIAPRHSFQLRCRRYVAAPSSAAHIPGSVEAQSLRWSD